MSGHLRDFLRHRAAVAVTEARSNQTQHAVEVAAAESAICWTLLENQSRRKAWRIYPNALLVARFDSLLLFAPIDCIMIPYVVFILLGVVVEGYKSTPDFDRANALYSSGHVHEAAQLYRRVTGRHILQGVISKACVNIVQRTELMRRPCAHIRSCSGCALQPRLNILRPWPTRRGGTGCN